MYIVCRPCSVADDKGHACQVIYAYTLILGTYVSWLLCYAVRINTSWAYYIGTSIYESTRTCTAYYGIYTCIMLDGRNLREVIRPIK